MLCNPKKKKNTTEKKYIPRHHPLVTAAQQTGYTFYILRELYILFVSSGLMVFGGLA